MNTSFLLGLLLGCFVTLLFQYLMNQSAHNKEINETYKNNRKELDDLFTDHPIFMNQIKNDLNNPENATINEFFVVEKTALMNSAIPRLRYDLNPDVLTALDRLERINYIQRLPNTSLLYKIDEELRKELKKIIEPSL